MFPDLARGFEDRVGGLVTHRKRLGRFKLPDTFTEGPDLPPRCRSEHVAGERADHEARGKQQEARKDPEPRGAFEGYVVTHFRTHLSGATSTAITVPHSAIVSGFNGQV